MEKYIINKIKEKICVSESENKYGFIFIVFLERNYFICIIIETTNSTKNIIIINIDSILGYK